MIDPAPNVGQSGVESLVAQPPRGFVEPDPATFEAIALLEAAIRRVKILGKGWLAQGKNSRDRYASQYRLRGSSSGWNRPEEMF